MGKTCVCFNLRRATRLVTQIYDQALRSTGLTGNQFSILIAAYDEGGRGMSGLARLLGTDRTTLTRNVAILERSGLLQVTPGEDKRERRVSVTEAGRIAVGNAMPFWERAQDRVVDVIGEQKWLNMLAGLRKLSDQA